MNRAITSHREYEDHTWPLRQAHYALLKLQLVNAGEDADMMSILEPVCFPTDRKEMECRKAEWVEFFNLALAAGVEVSTLPNLSLCDDLDVTSMELAIR